MTHYCFGTNSITNNRNLSVTYKNKYTLQTVLMLCWYCKSHIGNLVLNVEMLKLNVTSDVGISVVSARVCQLKVTAL